MSDTILEVETEQLPSKPRYSTSRKGIGGRKPKGIVANWKGAFTPEVVQRIASRFAKGIPIRYCLAVEKDRRINQDNWDNLVNKRPDLVRILDSARFTWLEPQIESLWAEKDWKAKTWLMERRFGNDFPSPQTQMVTINNDNRQVKLGITQDQLDTLSKLALEDAKQLKRAKQLQ